MSSSCRDFSTTSPILPPLLSPTSIRRYGDCPQAFRFDIEKRRKSDSSSPNLVLGKAMHGALCEFFSPENPARFRDRKAFETLFRRAWKRERGDRSVFGSPDEEADWGRQGLGMIATYCGTWDLMATPAHREWQVRVPLGRALGEVRGRIDRVDIKAHACEVIDYKTGSWPLEADDLRNDVAAMTYALAAAGHIGADGVTVTYRYVRLGCDVSWQPAPEALSDAGERLRDLVGTIRDDTVYASDPGRHCSWCPWALSCPDRKPLAASTAEEIASAIEGVPF